MSDEIEMPANCAECDGVWDLNMLNREMRCPACVCGRRLQRYNAPVTAASTHPAGCLGCEIDSTPHVWTPPVAAPAGSSS